MKNHRLKIISICLSLTTFSLSAHSGPSIVSGKYGCTAQMQRKLFTSKEYDGKTADSMMYIDFDNNTFYMQTNQIALPSNYPEGEPKYIFSGIKNAPMTVSTGALPNSYRVEVPQGGIIMYLMSVNSGNTYLIQGYNDHINGVCQKI